MLYNEPAARSGMRRAEKLGLWLAGVTLVVSSAIAVGAWQWPRDQEGAPPRWTGAPATSEPAPSPSATTAPVDAVSTSTYLADLSPRSGGDNLAALPRALKGTAGYDHPVVVRCPTNQSDDKVRTVSYLLRGRYLDFSATVRPYYTGEPDSRTHVTAVSGVKERDDTLTRRTAGTQFTATMAAPAPIVAAVDGAEELTIHVECESPEGFVVLVDAALSPTG